MNIWKYSDASDKFNVNLSKSDDQTGASASVQK